MQDIKKKRADEARKKYRSKLSEVHVFFRKDTEYLDIVKAFGLGNIATTLHDMGIKKAQNILKKSK